MPLIARFPFKRVGHSDWGPLDRPYADVFFQAYDSDRLVPIKMVVDTGADYTLLPSRYADLLGISLKKHCDRSESQGIGGKEAIYLLRDRIKIYIARWKMEIPVAFLARDDVPALLGRLRCLEKVSLLMKRKTTFIGR